MADAKVSQFGATTARAPPSSNDVSNSASSNRDAKLKTLANCGDVTATSHKQQHQVEANKSDSKGQTGRRFEGQGQPAMQLAPKLKHQANYPQRDIEKIRQFVELDWRSQLPEECELWQDEFERMMEDDWLVTRFLVRGFKVAAARQKGSAPFSKGLVDIVDSNNNECGHNEDAYLLELGYKETMRLIRDCHKFRSKFQVSNCRGLDEFPQAWTQLKGILSYRCDLVGNPVLYMRCKLHRPKLIEKTHLRHQFKRMLLYHLNRCDLALYNRPGKAICCVFDMSDATLDNFDRELIGWMLTSFKTYSPKLLSYIMIYNLPWFLSTTFKLITSNLLSRANKHSLRFVYGKEILGYIGEENLPDYISWKLADSGR